MKHPETTTCISSKINLGRFEGGTQDKSPDVVKDVSCLENQFSQPS